MKIRRILVPCDLSAPSKKAADYAAALASQLDAEISLLFVEGIFTYGVTGDLLESAAAIQFFEEHRHAATRNLGVLRDRLAKKRGIRVRAVFTPGVPWQAIGEIARKIGADLIVMATHGRTGVPHLLLGSVAEKVVRTAPCPVLTVRPEAGARGRKKTAA